MLPIESRLKGNTDGTDSTETTDKKLMVLNVGKRFFGLFEVIFGQTQK
jgi:hypothetical protein